MLTPPRRRQMNDFAGLLGAFIGTIVGASVGCLPLALSTSEYGPHGPQFVLLSIGAIVGGLIGARLGAKLGRIP